MKMKRRILLLAIVVSALGKDHFSGDASRERDLQKVHSYCVSIKGCSIKNLFYLANFEISVTSTENSTSLQSKAVASPIFYKEQLDSFLLGSYMSR